MADEQHIEQTPPKKKIDKRIVKQMHTKGRTAREIAEHFGTSTQYIKNIIYNDRKEKTAEALEPKKKPGRPPGSKNKRTLAEEKMLTNWESSPMAPAMREDKAELNKAASWFSLQCLTLGKTVDKDNIDSLYNALYKYVELCIQAGMPMLVGTALLAIGVHPQTMARWRNGTQRGNDERYRKFADDFDLLVNGGMEAAAAAGSVDRVLTIWWQKARFNMVEGTGEVKEDADPLGNKKSADAILAKYQDLLPDDN